MSCWAPLLRTIMNISARPPASYWTKPYCRKRLGQVGAFETKSTRQKTRHDWHSLGLTSTTLRLKLRLFTTCLQSAVIRPRLGWLHFETFHAHKPQRQPTCRKHGKHSPVAAILCRRAFSLMSTAWADIGATKCNTNTLNMVFATLIGLSLKSVICIFPRHRQPTKIASSVPRPDVLVS